LLRYHIGDVGIGMSPGPVRPLPGDIGDWRVRTLMAIRAGSAPPGLVLIGRTSTTTYALISVEDVDWGACDHYLTTRFGRRFLP